MHQIDETQRDARHGTAIASVTVCLGLFVVSALFPPLTQADDRSDPGEALESSAEESGQTPGFRDQIVPLLTKLGCNAGSCHGAAAGRGGMALSLFGSRPDSDYATIVIDLQGRRVHRVVPEKSLLLAKPSGLLDHEGGVLIDQGDEAWRAIEAWMKAGCPDDEAASLQSLELEFQDDSEPLTYRVVATDELGKKRDVTPFAALQADQPDAVEIDRRHHTVHFRQHGIHSLFARYRDQVAVRQRAIPFSEQIDAPHSSIIPSSQQPTDEGHAVDRLINERLQQLHLPPIEPTDEPSFLRRVYLDLLGRAPTLSECDAYLRSSNPTPRSQLVDTLLASDEFAQYQVFRWARRLGVRSLPNEPDAFQSHIRWLDQKIRDDAPIPEMATELVLALGDAREVGATHFTRSYPDPKARADAFGRFFLGIQLSCAQCHDHPLDRWTQDDFHGLAAIFAKTLPAPIVKWDPAGQIIHQDTKQPAAPKIPGQPDLLANDDPRLPLADWLKSENRLMAKAQVNWIWSELMGRGLVEPVDAISPLAPGNHPELLEHLTDYFLQQECRARPLIRYILNSRTYARRARSAEETILTERFLARAAPRPLGAESYMLAIARLQQHYATPAHDLPPALVATPAQNPYADWIDGNLRSSSLEILGRCIRPEACGNSSRTESTLRRELHLLNSPLLDNAIQTIADRWQLRRDEQVPLREIVDEFHRLAVQRPMTDSDWSEWSNELFHSDTQEERRRWEDFLWSMLVSQAFRTR
ncbi:DUF1549 domain-containing protein [Pirellula sp. SH-Sr6A]|uniref:DUF1549 domain-containing protein n=1 Tax=Pirellula sp. SH-Sr6A TaxID=1632865 RepID=UPI000A99C6D2|nr:DUF1549 domain-containing protein [Pirellula sp. SH-Sr6A]